MTETLTRDCLHCGIVNDATCHLCLLCGTRLDRPLDFSDRDATLDYFHRGGIEDIASAFARGDIAVDTADLTFQTMLDTSVKLALECSWGTMDVVFYRNNPMYDAPSLGVRWPDNTLLAGLELSFVVDGRDLLYATMDRPERTTRGSNYRFDGNLSSPEYEYRLAMYAEVRGGRGKTRYIKTEPLALVPDASAAVDGPYSLVRSMSRLKVK
jgi:hypothetical protein